MSFSSLSILYSKQRYGHRSTSLTPITSAMLCYVNYRNGPQRTASDRNGYRLWLITASVQVSLQYNVPVFDEQVKQRPELFQRNRFSCANINKCGSMQQSICPSNQLAPRKYGASRYPALPAKILVAIN